MKRSLFALLCIIAVCSSCSNISKNIDFLRANGITEIESVPTSFESGKGWKELAGDYVYFMSLFEAKSKPKMIYLLANRRTEEIIGAYPINDQMMTATVARDISPATIVTNYEEFTGADKERYDDMTALNELLKKMPELKDFSWKNELQNRIVSGIIMKTHFMYASSVQADDRLFNFGAEAPVQSALLEEILFGKHNIYNRSVQRLNTSVDMNQFIEKMDFVFKGNDGTIGQRANTDKRYINDIFTDDPIDFTGSGKMFFFCPFKSFIRIQEKGGSISYAPAIETFEYTFSPDKEGFPVFKRNTRFASLLSADHAKNQKQ